MKISCKYCGVVSKPHHCPHSKRKTDRTRIDNKIYESKEYRKLRKEVLKDYNYMCLWSLYIVGRVVKADTTHHIIEILDDESKATEYDNLIPLEESQAHKEVHALYKCNDVVKRKVQGLLREMIKAYKAKDFTLKKFKSRLDEIKKSTPLL
jgi:5-methylcytosine-specific restriction endonuclease McrA